MLQSCRLQRPKQGGEMIPLLPRFSSSRRGRIPRALLGLASPRDCSGHLPRRAHFSSLCLGSARSLDRSLGFFLLAMLSRPERPHFLSTRSAGVVANLKELLALGFAVSCVRFLLFSFLRARLQP